MVSGVYESTTKAENSGTKDVFFHKLVRSMSGRDIANGNGSGLTTSENTRYDSELRNQSSTSLSSQKSQKRKLNVGERLKRLSHDLPLKLWTNSKSEPASPRVSSIEVEDTGNNAYDVTSRHGKMLSVVDERMEDTQAGMIPSTAKHESLSPATLAQRLRDLIDPLPFPSVSYPIRPPKLPPRDKKGRPIPPPSSSIKDRRLVELLSSATFMNGSRSGVKPRPSVWNILEEMGVPPHGFPEERVDGGGGESDDPPIDDQPDYSGTSTVMVYSPLIPTKDDIVELGELIPVSVEEEPISNTTLGKSWTSLWPLSMLPGWPQYKTQAPVMEDPLRGGFSQDFIVRSDVITMDDSGRRLRLKTTSAWVPSTTKVSFQVMWWGYRLWLPPPVMAVLSDRTLEVSKRASLIATALAWFFNNLPVDLFPIQVRPALFLMQRIVPYLGYIATFISWSWGSIKGYDIGYGVTLSATWLVPFALIPGTWHEKDAPKSPAQRSPAILRTSPTTSPNLPPMNITNDSPISSPPVSYPIISHPNQPLQPEASPSQPSSQPTTGEFPSTTPITSGRTGEATRVMPDFSIPSLSVSPPWAFAKRIFAFSPTKTLAAADSESSPGLAPIQAPFAPMPRTPVQTGSELGEKLLQAPVLRPIPLPECDTLPQGKGSTD